MDTSPVDWPALGAEIERDLRANLLPFWMTRVPDLDHGGFYGALSNAGAVDNAAPRTAVLYGRILWTFSAAYRVYGTPAYLETAERARAYLNTHLWDDRHQGVFWSVDRHGRPLEARKHSYAQAFALYGYSEHYRAADLPTAGSGPRLCSSAWRPTPTIRPTAVTSRAARAIGAPWPICA